MLNTAFASAIFARGNANLAVAASPPTRRRGWCNSVRMARLLAPLLLLTGATRGFNISCQIFEETMVCDSEKDLVHRGEIRTCSG